MSIDYKKTGRDPGERAIRWIEKNNSQPIITLFSLLFFSLINFSLRGRFLDGFYFLMIAIVIIFNEEIQKYIGTNIFPAYFTIIFIIFCGINPIALIISLFLVAYFKKDPFWPALLYIAIDTLFLYFNLNQLIEPVIKPTIEYVLKQPWTYMVFAFLPLNYISIKVEDFFKTKIKNSFLQNNFLYFLYIFSSLIIFIISLITNNQEVGKIIILPLLLLFIQFMREKNSLKGILKGTIWLFIFLSIIYLLNNILK